MRHRISAHALLVFLSLILLPATASAFCGFYVAGSGEDLYNDATQVALMRAGQHTILAMENNYRGPLEDFAMVVPVPQILGEADVKTLEPELFRKLDKLTAPRLVQYWEKNPCKDNVIKYTHYKGGCGQQYANNTTPANNAPTGNNFTGVNNSTVTVEAQFAVGEYEVVVLSSEEATGLESWLTSNNYNIPQGATEIFEQYIQQGMYFFVAKIDPTKVVVEDGQAILSPLRFGYTSNDFSLPIRLGMVNSAGSQDLLVYTLGVHQAYEPTNYPVTPIPTNINVTSQVKTNFPAFYEKIFTRTLAEHPGAIVQEYAWSPMKCDPCPVPPMDGDDLATLGADTFEEFAQDPWLLQQMSIARFHVRYGKNAMTEDIVFGTSPGITGGFGTSGTEQRPTQRNTGVNQFQGRYIIHNQFDGAMNCEHKVRGRWDGQPKSGESSAPVVAPGPNTDGAASDTLAEYSIEQLIDTTVPKTGTPIVIEEVIDLGECMDGKGPESKPPEMEVESMTEIPIDYKPKETVGEQTPSPRSDDYEGEDSAGGCNTSAAAPGGGLLVMLLGLVGLLRRRRER